MLIRTIKRFKPGYKHILISMAAMIVVVVTNGVSLVTLKPIIDEIFVTKSGNVSFTIPIINISLQDTKIAMLMWLVGFFIFSRILYCIALYLNRFSMMLAGEIMVNKLRIDLYERLLRFSPSFYSKSRTGELISNLTYDLGLVQHLASTLTADFLRRPFEVIFLVGLLFAFDVKLAILSLIVAPFIVVIVNKLGASIHRRAGVMQANMGNTASSFNETATGIKTIQSFSAETAMQDRFTNLVSVYLKSAKHAYLATAAATPITEFVTAISIAAIIIYGGLAVIEGKTSTGSFFTFMAILMATYQPVKTLVNAIAEGSRAGAALERVYKILDTQPSVKNIGSRKFQFTKGLRYEDVSFSYDTKEERKTALNNISLLIPKGQTVAIVGPSGSGKSTLLSLIPRFYDPTLGRILIDDIDIRELDLASLRKQIGIVLQETFLFNDTIAANISLGKPGASRKEIEKAIEASYLKEFVAELPQGIDTIVGERGAMLSGGEKQRIAIARALLIDPPILLLDEATSSLDSESEQRVQNAIERLIQGRTTIIIAHRLSTVQRADRIIVLENGKIVEQGSHDELISAGGLYSHLHELQFKS